MKPITKKVLTFIIGCAFGAALLLMPPLFPQILGFPAKVGFLISEIILWPICKLDTTGICRGLGLDGGPLAWIEWTGLFGGMIIGYGIIFLLIYLLYLKAKK